MVTDNGRRREAAKTAEDDHTCPVETVADSREGKHRTGSSHFWSKDEALMEKEKGTQGLELSSYQYRKQGLKCAQKETTKLLKLGTQGRKKSFLTKETKP